MTTLKTTNPLLNVVLTTLFVMIASVLIANEPPTEGEYLLTKDQKQEIQHLVDQEITFPTVAKKFGITGIVKAQIMVTPYGKLSIEAINGEKELINYVKESLKRVTIEDYTLIGKIFIVQFHFRS
ncbi:MAG: hypothetical protein PF489_04940 [Salinivirgaceae bacterium]|jgi:hypothetical protein|nr:hypothetical protein [Salinivirgaceae bacterium]